MVWFGLVWGVSGRIGVLMETWPSQGPMQAGRHHWRQHLAFSVESVDRVGYFGCIKIGSNGGRCMSLYLCLG